YNSLLLFLHFREGSAPAQRRRIHRNQRGGRPGQTRRNGGARQRPHHGAANLHRIGPCGRVGRTSCPLRGRQARFAIGRLKMRAPMTTADGAATFRVALIQMRSGRTPSTNLDAATKLIGEAKAGGADYVQTPEMTNILEARRDALMAAIVPEHEDPSLAAFRDLARQHRLWLHIGSLALKVSPDRAANRGFLIDPQGEIAARYDKIHMFDVDLADAESYRESRSYAPGELAVSANLPW